MMPGIGFAEMVMLVLVAVVVIGPKDLPLMMRKFGRMTGKVRAMAFEFKQGFDELGRQAELDELRKEVEDLKKSTGLDDLQQEFEQDRINLEKDVNSAMAPAALPTPAVKVTPEAQAASDAESATVNGHYTHYQPSPAALEAGQDLSVDDGPGNRIAPESLKAQSSKAGHSKPVPLKPDDLKTPVPVKQETPA